MRRKFQRGHLGRFGFIRRGKAGLHGGGDSGTPSVANYLHVSGTTVRDSSNAVFIPKGAQWVGFNNTGMGYNWAAPHTNSNPNPVTNVGDAFQAASLYKLNTVRLAISWHMVERNAPTLISPGLYKHDWTNNAGVINLNWDTPDGYLAALQGAISDLRANGLRVILELQQSNWSPGCDPVAGAGFPAWLYATPTPGGDASTEPGCAKWEFFQAGGGWARPGIPGPPQDLLKDFWKLICTHFKDDDTVVGIDFINEAAWPASHPLPGTPSAIANPNPPTDANLVACYQGLINMAAAIQPHWLLIYENGTYGNSVNGRSPLTGTTTPPTGSNLVMSWHYYPENTKGTGITLADVNTFKGYLSAQVALAHTTFGHAFWMGETSMFHHIENNAGNRTFDIADTVYSSSYQLWEKLLRDMIADAIAGSYGWCIWAFQTGAGRSILNSDGTPKIDFLSAIGATPDPPASLGPATPIIWAASPDGSAGSIGPNVYPGSTDHWTSQQWIDKHYDSGIFGRADKAAPVQLLPTADITITSDGTLAGTTITNADFVSGGFVKSGSDGAVVVTCNVKVNSLTVNGPTNPAQLLITGKLWPHNKNGNIAMTLAAYNASFNNADPGGFINFTNCTPALTNFYQFCPSGKDPAIRFSNCRVKDALTPYIDGFLAEGVTRDWLKPGSGNADLWLRHGTMAFHPYAYIITDPTSAGTPPAPPALQVPLPSNYKNPPTFVLGGTYNLHDCVINGNKHKFYCIQATTNAEQTPSELGGSNSTWQFYGDTHADGEQAFVSVNNSGRPVAENVFFYQTNHAAMYLEDATKAGNPYWNDQDYQWNNTTAYKVANNTATWTDNTGAVQNASHVGSPDLVRGSDGRQYYCVADNTGVDPTTDNGTHWAIASSSNQTMRYCLNVGRNETIANGSEDPNNGAYDCLFSRSAGTTPVQGTKASHDYDGINKGSGGTLIWLTDPIHLGGANQIRGIVNKRNLYADNGALIEGSSAV